MRLAFAVSFPKKIGEKMGFRKLCLLLLSILPLIAFPVLAHAYQDDFNVTINGARAGGTSAIVTFKRDLTPSAIRHALASGGFSVHSFHTKAGTRHAPADLIKSGAYKSSDLAFTLVKFDGMDLAAALDRLSKMPGVVRAEPNYIRTMSYIPDDELYQQYQYNFRQINSEMAWNVSKGKDVVVAVVDTGYRGGLDDAPANLLEGYDFRMDDTDVQDYVGHGTHVSNTIAENTDNEIGAAGLAFSANLLPLKVFSDDPQDEGAYDSDIADAINYAVENGANVINMSLGSAAVSYAIAQASLDAHDAGVVVVAASGNEGTQPADYPAGNEGVIGVGSSRPHSSGSSPNRSSFANYGTGLDFLAPGENIVQQTFNADTGEAAYYSYWGTSMASPHVTAVVALLLAVGPADPDAVEQTLIDTAVRNSEDWDNDIGWGEVDAYAAAKKYHDDNDDWHSGDDDTSDDDTQSSSDDTSETVECIDLLTVIYTDCHLTITQSGEAMPGAEAFNLCQSGEGEWACMVGCRDGGDVADFADFAQCLNDECGVTTAGTGGDDDDDSSGACG
jgi:hypothetical protein